MTIIRHPTNSEIFVGTPDEFGLSIQGDFSAAGHWIASVNGVEQDLMCLDSEQAMREGERVFALATDPIARSSAEVAKIHSPLYQLPPLTLGQLEQLTHALEVVSAGEANPDSEVFQLLDLVRQTRIEAIKFKQRNQERAIETLSRQVFKINPNDPECFGTVNPGIEALRKLEGRQVAMLAQQELVLLRVLMDQGRKQGVSVEFDTDTDVQGWAEMNSVRALEILAVANSYVRLRFT